MNDSYDRLRLFELFSRMHADVLAHAWRSDDRRGLDRCMRLRADADPDDAMGLRAIMREWRIMLDSPMPSNIRNMRPPEPPLGLIRSDRPRSIPLTILLGGPAGSGKTHARQLLAHRYGCAQTDADLLRSLTPAYLGTGDLAARTNADAFLMLTRLDLWCEEHAVSYVVEGTWSHPEETAGWVERNHAKGRRVLLCAMGTSPGICRRLARDRALDAWNAGLTVRRTDPVWQERALEGMPDRVREVIRLSHADGFLALDETGRPVGDTYADWLHVYRGGKACRP